MKHILKVSQLDSLKQMIRSSQADRDTAIEILDNVDLDDEDSRHTFNKLLVILMQKGNIPKDTGEKWVVLVMGKLLEYSGSPVHSSEKSARQSLIHHMAREIGDAYGPIPHVNRVVNNTSGGSNFYKSRTVEVLKHLFKGGKEFAEYLLENGIAAIKRMDE